MSWATTATRAMAGVLAIGGTAVAADDPVAREVAAPVQAQLVAPRPMLRLETLLGIGAPLGFYGVAIEAQVWQRLWLWGGMGGNRLELTPAYELALQGRLEALRLNHTTLELGLGWSYGNRRDYPSQSGVREWKSAIRLDTEVGLRQELTPRLSVRAFGGLGYTLNQARCWISLGNGTVIQGACNQEGMPANYQSGRSLSPYGGVAVAYALYVQPEGWPPPRTREGYGDATLALDATAGLIPLLAHQIIDPGSPSASTGA
jgi:hypothetical protein